MQQVRSILSSVWSWYRGQRRRTQLIVGGIAVFLLLAMCGGITDALGANSTTPQSATNTSIAGHVTATAKPAAKPTATATPQAIQYPPKTEADLQGLAAMGDASAVHEFHSESVGLTGVCPIPKRGVVIDASITGKQLAEDLLAYYYGQSLDNPCGSIVFAYHSQGEVDTIGYYTAGRINLDVTDANGQANIDPNGTNLSYKLTLDTGDALSNQEYIVTY